MPALHLGFDDMDSAYRRIPTATPWFTVFGIWSFKKQRVHYYYMNGHNFGQRASVLNFNAFPKFVVAFLRVFFAIPADQYFDDFMLVDLLRAGMSAQYTLHTFLITLGFAASVLSIRKKRKAMARSNIGLGVNISLDDIERTGSVRISPSMGRVENILEQLHAAAIEGYLPPGEASSIRGKLGFIFSSTYGRFGRAVLQPLTQRQYFDTDFDWTSELQSMYEFLQYVLPRLPPLIVGLRRDARDLILVYTDAMEARGVVRIGFYVRATAGREFHSALTLDREFIANMFHGEHVIAQASSPINVTTVSVSQYPIASAGATEPPLASMQAECLAAITVYYSLAALKCVHNKRILHFVDNTAALSALVHGYASKGDFARQARPPAGAGERAGPATGEGEVTEITRACISHRPPRALAGSSTLSGWRS